MLEALKALSIGNIKKAKMNIATHSLNEILENKKVIDFFNSTKDFKSAHECCKIQCGVING